MAVWLVYLSGTEAIWQWEPILQVHVLYITGGFHVSCGSDAFWDPRRNALFTLESSGQPKHPVCPFFCFMDTPASPVAFLPRARSFSDAPEFCLSSCEV